MVTLPLKRLSVLFLTALGIAATAPPVHAQEKAVFGFPAPHNVQFSYLWYGNKLGFFKDEGLALDVITVTGSGVLLPQVAARLGMRADTLERHLYRHERGDIVRRGPALHPVPTPVWGYPGRAS